MYVVTTRRGSQFAKRAQERMTRRKPHASLYRGCQRLTWEERYTKDKPMMLEKLVQSQSGGETYVLRPAIAKDDSILDRGAQRIPHRNSRGSFEGKTLTPHQIKIDLIAEYVISCCS